MSEAKPTPGEWIFGDWMQQGNVDSGWVDVWATEPDGSRSLPFIACKHMDAHANAKLAAEAGNTYNTTGLTPSQLAERVKELEDALERISSIEDQMYGADWQEIEEARDIARAALAKSQGENA